VRGNILLVEDNERIQLNNKSILERHGYTVRIAMDLKQARLAVAQRMPDIIVLDIALPDGSGLNFLRELRKASQVPVLLLTAMGTTADATAGLDAGSDDYLIKPYNTKEFRARVDALMRRVSKVPETVSLGRLALDVTAGIATVDGKDLLLAQKEFALLLIFVQNEGRYFGADYLYERIWKAPLPSDSNALKSAIARLRAKMGDCGWSIEWSRNEGYYFEST